MGNLKIFSFFSGSGFLDLGFELAGYSIDLVNEFSPAFMGAYKYSREKMGLKKPIHGYSIISSLNDESIISAFPGAEPAAKFIDCIWFQNHRFMPAVMEVEHTTGVTSGLTRMKGLQDALPALNTRYVIVAPDDDREKVVDEVNRQQFLSLDARYFPYSAVEELFYICTHRGLHGVNQEFLDCYMEKVCVL